MNIGGQEYLIVCLRPGDPSPEGMDADDYGWTDFDNGTIYVRMTGSTSRNHDTLTHEKLHAAFEGSGAQWFLGQVCEKAGMDQEFVIELVIRMLTPALMGAMP